MSAYSEILDRYAAEGRLRKIPADRSEAAIIDLCSNDYMGLARRQHEWEEEFRSRWGGVSMTASASRLLASDQAVFNLLEKYLGDSYAKSALMFNSGYHANTGLVSALNIPGTLWISDKLIHASVIDGLRMSGGKFKRWNHNDTSHLQKILRAESDNWERMIVLCESIYSMDGDVAPLKELVELKKEFPKMMLYIDEAHALGVYGPRGLGKCAELGLLPEVDILVGTLGKACASVGAFAVTSPELQEYLVNSARSLIFSTAIAPANAAWSLMMLEKLAGMDEQRRHLAKLSERFKRGIEELTGKPNPSSSPIVPLLTGNAEKAVTISAALERVGILALPIRRPTVPPGGERIRFSLHAGLTFEDIDIILDKIKDTKL